MKTNQKRKEVNINNLPLFNNSVEVTKHLTVKTYELLDHIFNNTLYIKNNKIDDEFNIYKIVKDFKKGTYGNIEAVDIKFNYIISFIGFYEGHITNITSRVFNTDHYNYISEKNLNDVNEILINLPGPKFGDTIQIMADKNNNYDYTYKCFAVAFKMEKLKLL